MPDLSKDDYEFLVQFRSAEGFICECPAGDGHEVEASDWRRIIRILSRLIGDEESGR